MNTFHKQLETIRKQSQEDFKFVMIALDNVTNGLNNVTTGLNQVGKELGRVKGKMARQEERFESMLDIVQNALGDSVNRTEFEEVKARVEALERKTA